MFEEAGDDRLWSEDSIASIIGLEPNEVIRYSSFVQSTVCVEFVECRMQLLSLAFFHMLA